jgi:hypothetical protein
VKPKPRVVIEDGPEVKEEAIDPDPRLALKFNWEMRFGLTTTEKAGEGNAYKKLTYSDDGSTNTTVVRVNGTDEPFGATTGGTTARWVRIEAALGKDEKGRERLGKKSVWLSAGGKVQITQVVEIIPSAQPVEVEPGKQMRVLDTCLVRYLIENKDTESHRVGLRFELDTYIGSNDGVPFTLPGADELCDTHKEFESAEDVPDFIQAQEHPSLKSPGTVAHLTLKMGGGLEAPARVLLTHWRGAPLWEVPLADIGRDSAVAMYWPERELKPGAKRTVGFAYGLGTVTSTGSGKLAVTLGGSFRPKEVFTVTAKVSNPVKDQTLTLYLPKGLELVECKERQRVPPLPKQAANQTSLVTWKVKILRTGKYALKVESSTGISQSKTITITKPLGKLDLD